MSCMKEEVSSMAPEAQVTRRQFVVTTLAAGFALAVQPVSAETITTDTKGLIAGEVEIPTRDGQIPAYRAMPATGNSFPVVLVVQEIFGVHEYIRDICRRFAKLGTWPSRLNCLPIRGMSRRCPISTTSFRRSCPKSLMLR